MRLSGVQLKSLDFSKLFFLIILFSPLGAYSKDCPGLKDSILTNPSSIQDEDLKELNKGVDADNLCFKNILGIMAYKGIHFPQNKDRAQQIFYDLSNKDYPEAQFNFALLLSERDNQNPVEVASLLLGIFNKYLRDTKNIHLALKARDLGYSYVDNLQASPKLKLDDIKDIKEKFENGIKTPSIKFAQDLEAQANASKEQLDNVMMILSIGMLAYGITSNIPSASSYRPQWHMTPTTNIGNIYSFY